MDVRHANEAERLARISTHEPNTVRAAIPDDLHEQAREEATNPKTRQGRYDVPEVAIRETAQPADLDAEDRDRDSEDDADRDNAAREDREDRVTLASLKRRQDPHEARLPDFVTPDDDESSDDPDADDDKSDDGKAKPEDKPAAAQAKPATPAAPASPAAAKS